MSTDSSKKLNPRTKTYEWGGPFGALCTTISLPLLVIFLNGACATSTANACTVDYFYSNPGGVKAALQTWYAQTVASVRAATTQLHVAVAMLLAWHLFHCIFYLCFPLGERGLGLPLRNGKRLKYNFSGSWSYLVSMLACAVAHYAGWWNWGSLVDQFVPLMLGSILLSVLYSIMLYAASFRRSGDDGTGEGPVMLALGGNSGNPIYDFFVGRELNPRLGELDFKFLFELRPGLIFWIILDVAFVIRAAQDYQQLHQKVSFAAAVAANLPVLGAALANAIYIVDGLWFEPGDVSMMDIAYDGFGFMLCFGDIAWVPFLYTLQCKFLCAFPKVAQALPPWYLALCVVIYVAGFVIFRGANSDKDRFRKDPSDSRVAHLKTMKTSRGSSLIVSGFWGACRHPNYVGDWLMVVATSMFTGWSYLLPYFQVVYFAVLLIHRQMRDEEWMLKKYGKDDWAAYCKRVPSRLIPGVY